MYNSRCRSVLSKHVKVAYLRLLDILVHQSVKTHSQMTLELFRISVSSETQKLGFHLVPETTWEQSPGGHLLRGWASHMPQSDRRNHAGFQIQYYRDLAGLPARVRSSYPKMPQNHFERICKSTTRLELQYISQIHITQWCETLSVVPSSLVQE